MANGEGTPVRVGPDYKTLFLGSCSLLVLVCGSLWGLWNQYATEQAESNRQTNAKQWDKLSEIQDRLLVHGTRLDWQDRHAEDLEARLRALERKSR